MKEESKNNIQYVLKFQCIVSPFFDDLPIVLNACDSNIQCLSVYYFKDCTIKFYGITCFDFSKSLKTKMQA